MKLLFHIICRIGALLLVVAAASQNKRLDAAPGEGRVQRAESSARVTDLLASPNWGENAPGPLCGVFAACTALDIVGVKVNPRDFIATKYIGRCGGSSPRELARIVDESGANSRVLSRMSVLDLRLISCPVVANVRLSPASTRFNHWVVAVPSAEGVTVVDGLQEPNRITTAEFLAVWSGVGICVSTRDQDPLVTIWLGRLASLLFLALIALFVRRNIAYVRWGTGARASCRFGGVFTASILFSLAGNAVFGDLAHHSKGLRAAVAADSRSYRAATLADAKKASLSRDVLLVDARREVDYRFGTIKGAVNIPVTASTWEINRYLEKIDRTTPIIVFCQSKYCAYDETIAAQLASLGFTDVAVCDEGWSEYRNAESGTDRDNR